MKKTESPLSGFIPTGAIAFGSNSFDSLIGRPPVAARAFIDGSLRIAPDFFGGLDFPVVNPRQEFVFVEIDLTTLTAARNLAQTRQRIDRIAGFAQNPACLVDQNITFVAQK